MLDAVDQVKRSQGMNGGKRCPRCWQDIGLSPTLYLYANKLECPHCELPLRYEEPLKFVLSKLCLFVLLGGGLYVLVDELPTGLILLWCLVFLFLWTGVEALAGSFLRETGTLRVRH